MKDSKVKIFWRIILVIFYLLAGIAHLRSPAGFLAITPPWVPYPAEVVMVTGIAEIAGATGLMIGRFRYAAGIGLALYALCVWPANIHHMVNNIEVAGQVAPLWYHVPRMIAQPFIIWLALWAGGVTDWPFRRRSP
ncbi:DoxX family protein [Sphingorhabdus arenilitoris]|uniref:DoxX family protein n=1 Tax=Sphingorhabdus arenilitoris TaxID=1490041 RepID=A0ABV8RD68_9SPHN